MNAHDIGKTAWGRNRLTLPMQMNIYHNPERAPPVLVADHYQTSTIDTDFREFGVEEIDRTAVMNFLLRGDATKEWFTVIAGQRMLWPMVRDWKVTEQVADYWRSKGEYADALLEHLSGKTFDGTIYAPLEGEVMFAGGPIIRLENAPKWAEKRMESLFTNIIRSQSGPATKVARARFAAGPDMLLLEAGLRRSVDPLGVETALTAYICGATATSNELAGFHYPEVPTGGTMDHYSVMTGGPRTDNREMQRRMFRANLKHRPKPGLLPDTINNQIGLDDALEELEIARREGYFKPTSVRWDSGDFWQWVPLTRQELDRRGFTRELVKIVPSGGIKAIVLAMMRRDGLPVDAVLLGEYLIHGSERAARAGDVDEKAVNLQIVGKNGQITEVDGSITQTVKFSENPAKSTYPGRQDRLRFLDGDGFYVADVNVDLETFEVPEDGVLNRNVEAVYDGKVLEFKAGSHFVRPIRKVWENHKLVEPERWTIPAMRAYHAETMARLPSKHKELLGNWEPYPVAVEAGLVARTKAAAGDQTFSFGL